MKKILKQIAYITSLAALMILVLLSNIFTKLGGEEKGDQKNKNLSSEGLFSAFDTQTAFADAPSGGGNGDSGISGCSADGAGSSACGAGT